MRKSDPHWACYNKNNLGRLPVNKHNSILIFLIIGNMIDFHVETNSRKPLDVNSHLMTQTLAQIHHKIV